MSELSLKGLDNQIKTLDREILISKSNYNNLEETINDIRIDLLEDNQVINGIDDENMIRGLISLSNYYLSSTEEQDEFKKHKTKLEKIILNGAVVKIKKGVKTKDIQLWLKIDEKTKFKFRANSTVDALLIAEDFNIKPNLDI